MNRHFESKECFSAASCEVLWQFLMEAETLVFIVERRLILIITAMPLFANVYIRLVKNLFGLVNQTCH